MKHGLKIAVARPPFRLVPRTEVERSRAALDRARWTCEGCKADINLRVVEAGRELAVLCAGCRAEQTPFGQVMARRKARKRMSQ